MTYNKDYHDCKSCREVDKLSKCNHKHPKPKKILLECGEGTGSRTFTSSNELPFQLAHVTVDTTGLKRPEVLIKFSSLVKLELLASNLRIVRLKYELFRTCNGEEPLSVGTWMYEQVNPNLFSSLEESFGFIFCESIACHGCYGYFVTVTPVEISDATVTVSNGQMAALTEAINPKDTILACGQGNGGIVYKDDALLLSADIAHVSIDTTCLIKPKMLIEFSCLIKFSEDFEDAILKFELFRVCDDGEPVSRGFWTFEIGDIDTLYSRNFGFIFCECEVPSSCCNYFVKVIPIAIDADNIEDDATVYNARMTALAQSQNESFHTQPKEIFFECGNNAGSRTFTSPSEQPFQIAHVAIDTHFLCKPMVNIEFSSTVSYQLMSIVSEPSIQLRYELFRKCDNRRELSLGVWELQVNLEDGNMIEAIESFNLTFCDHIECCSGCVDYFVTVTPVELITEADAMPTVATVSNGRIAALVGEKSVDQYVICKPKHQEHEKISLECGQGNGSRTFTSSNDSPFQLAHVTINPTCLNRSNMLIKFSSLVRLEKIDIEASSTVRLQYELFRTCDGAEPISLGVWKFEKSDTLSEVVERFTLLEESFSFNFCESSSNCHDCCSFFVSVTPMEIANATVAISTGQMAALAEVICPRDIILACGQGNGGIVFKDTDNPSIRVPADIAHVTIDITPLNKPKVLIEFSCIIKLAEDFRDAIILFELFRVYGDCEPVSQGVWRFEIANAQELISKAFSFVFCECNALPKCYDYFVRVVPIEIDTSTDNDILIHNARMTALAESSKEKLASHCINSKLLQTKSKEIILECGHNTGKKTFTSQSEQPFLITGVTIDTSSLCKPMVNIEFSSIVNFRSQVTLEGSVQLRYELFRKCDNRTQLSLGIWEFVMVNEENQNITIESTESFGFTYCDSEVCPGCCCDYFVTVTAVELVQDSLGPTIATVSNGRIAAIAQER